MRVWVLKGVAMRFYGMGTLAASIVLGLATGVLVFNRYWHEAIAVGINFLTVIWMRRIVLRGDGDGLAVTKRGEA